MNRKINIAQVIYGLKYGGAEKLLIPVSTKLDKNKFNVIVVALTCGGPVEDELKKKSIDVHVLRRDGGFDLFDLFGLIRLIKMKNIDIIHTHLQNADLWAGCAAKICKIKHISAFHGTYFKKSPSGFLKQRLRVILPDKIIAVNQATADYCTMHLKAKKDKVAVIYNGIDLDRFKIAVEIDSKKREMGISEKALVLGTIGRLEVEKGHRYLIEAVSHLKNSYPDIIVLIVGEGSLRQKLTNMSLKLGLKEEIKFLGERKDVPELLKIIDIVVIPSLSEGLPIACLEAMSAGRPIVATNVGGIPELIDDGVDGLLVPSCDSSALARVILTLIEDKDLANRLSKDARQKAYKYFSEENMIAEIEMAYEETFP